MDGAVLDRRNELLGLAREMIPDFRARAAEAESARRLPDANHEAMRDAGLYRALQPERFGGDALDLGMMIDVAAELGRGCGSSAWIFTNLAMQAWVNGMKAPEAQEELWADGKDALVASAFPGKDAKIDRVTDGFEVSGTWHYASGIDFATGLNLQIFYTPDNRPPEQRFAYIPASDYTVVDDWFMTGLAATGSRSVEVRETFIPDYRTLNSRDVQGGASPGSEINDATLYKLPFWGIGGKAFSGPAIGIARGAQDIMEDDLSGRVGARGARLAEQSTVQVRIAESGAEIDAAWALLQKDCADAADMVESGAEFDLVQRTKWRRNNSYAVQLCLRGVERLYQLAGMRGMYSDSDIQRASRDVHAAASQVAIAWDPQAANYAKARFGLGLADPRAS